MIGVRFRSFLFANAKLSYAQCGEDLIADFVFEALRISKPSYLDLGAHHPTYMSNTFLLYSRGSHGVCVEPDPELFVELRRKRPRDICLNVGVGLAHAQTADYYVMTTKALNTFSKSVAERYQSYGSQKIEKVVPVPLLPINQIIEQYCKIPPQFISMDIEGFELQILNTLDFKRFRPLVLCVETLTYTEDRTESKLTDVIDFVCEQGYLLYADTFINSIFVDRHAWKNR